VQWARLGDGIGYIHVRRIRQGLEVSLDQALTALGDIKGLVVDVRGNSGGGFDDKTAFGNFDLAPVGSAAPHHPLYKGPIAVLIDERCISAGEGWTSWFVARKRARLFGTTTAGASARKETYTLSNGLYKVEIPVKAYTGFLDRPIERRGLEPDVEVRCSARDISSGKDTVAEAAVEWLMNGGQK
jgi:carboxyl-terminal processing protease